MLSLYSKLGLWDFLNVVITENVDEVKKHENIMSYCTEPTQKMIDIGVSALSVKDADDFIKEILAATITNNNIRDVLQKQELAEIMRSADDRVNNQLVVDENGYAKLITSHEVGSLYAVYNECWCAGNNYVGKYSSLDTLECDYLHMLQGWLYYLQTGESQYAKYFDDEISAEILLSEILHFYNT